MTVGVIFDSLPYLDKEYDDVAMKEYVDALIMDNIDTKHSKDALDVLKKFIPPNAFYTYSPMIKEEMERIERGEKLTGIDMSHYNLKPNVNNAEITERAAQMACAQVEYLKDCLVNLELLRKFGPDAWKVSNYVCEKMVERVETQVESLQSEIAQVNKKRKLLQVDAGYKITALEEKWKQLVGTRLRLEQTNMALERQIE